jgi:hypothetical protein
VASGFSATQLANINGAVEIGVKTARELRALPMGSASTSAQIAIKNYRDGVVSMLESMASALDVVNLTTLTTPIGADRIKNAVEDLRIQLASSQMGMKPASVADHLNTIQFNTVAITTLAARGNLLKRSPDAPGLPPSESTVSGAQAQPRNLVMALAGLYQSAPVAGPSVPTSAASKPAAVPTSVSVPATPVIGKPAAKAAAAKRDFPAFPSGPLDANPAAVGAYVEAIHDFVNAQFGSI